MNKSGVPKIHKTYHIPLNMFDDAFLQFQKKFVYPTNIALSVILAAIAGVYIHAVIKDSSQTLAYLLIMVCIALILVRWYKTFKLRKAVHDALQDVEQDSYELKIWDAGIWIHIQDAPKIAETAENTVEEPAAETAESPQEEQAENGFNAIFPEEPAETEEPIPPTEIPFGDGIRILEYPDYFIVYILKQNFYIIPKKDFDAAELEQMRKLFGI
ncbi:MAG: YcxB family protein [Oscillospiraceae bacterium]|nr:YcxB family protein [Oscillospiraceae bacterium]